MRAQTDEFPPGPALARFRRHDGTPFLALQQQDGLRDLSAAGDPRLHSLDTLLTLPAADIFRLLEDPALNDLPSPRRADLDLLPPVESQEVWACGVTYLRSREARREEAVVKDIYSAVYEAERPELFFKAAGWRVVPHGGEVGIRSDSTWDVPEPELAILSNAYGETIAYSIGNDMSSRSIEGENPLYLPQAKVYDNSCSLGPVAVLAAHWNGATITMRIERDGREIFAGASSIHDMVRDRADLVRVLHAAYTLPAGAWLLTGTSIVPSEDYSVMEGDVVRIAIDGLGELRNTVKTIVHSGAQARPLLRDR